MTHPAKMKFGRYDIAACLGFTSYACCALGFSTLLLPLSESLHFSLTDGNHSLGGALHFWRSIAMCAMMLYSLFLVRHLQKKQAVGVALLVTGTGIILCAMTGNYRQLLLAIIFSSLGQGMFEVLITPTVREIHHREDSAKYINFIHAFWSVGVVSVVLLTGALIGVSISWRFQLFCIGLLPLLPALIFLMPSGKSGSFSSVSSFQPNSGRYILHILHIRRFWIFLICMFLAGGGEHCLLFWLPSVIRQQFHSSSLFCALGTAVFATGMFSGRILSGLLGSREKMRQIILLSSFFSCSLAFLPLLLNTLPGLYFSLFAIGLTSGPLWPSIQNLCVSTLKEDSTTMLILLPVVGIPGCGFFPWLMGICGDIFTLHQSILLVPLCYLLLFILISLPCYPGSSPSSDRSPGKNSA